MDLSVIIVNYNVKHFLEQCLLSVRKARHGLDAEVIVVDNNSVDGSQQMLKEKFGKEIILIENRDNPGFSKANNQGIDIAKGRYVLLLNPDTVVEETTFSKCLEFMDSHEKAGALGVKMLDGQGQFLPESKRSLPTAWVSFYKIFGLAKMFPGSKRFGKYHLTYLDKEETHKVEVLSGAFMWMRKSVLNEIGNLDEDFFMYGEDIDLSYRVIKGGYENYYFADTQIIHYKGESTKKGSLNYVRVFYNAMIIFAQKHFGGSRKRLFIFMIRLAVYLRAAIAVLSRLVKRLGFPVIEGGLFYGVIFGIKSYWEHYVKYIEGGAYPESFDLVAAPVYTLIFVGLLWVAGAYKKPFKIPPIITATLGAFVMIATVSYVFPQINFSRAIVGLSSIFAMLIALTTRGLINLREKGTIFFTEPSQRKVLLAGAGPGLRRMNDLIRGELDYDVEVIGQVSDGLGGESGVERLGGLDQLEEVVRFYQPAEIIFDNKGLPTEQIIDLMSSLRGAELTYKIMPPDADYLVGPQFIYTSRYSKQISFNLERKDVRLQKQVFDLVSSGVLLLSFPLLFWLYRRPGKALGQLWRVLTRRSHMVGYIQSGQEELPQLKPGVLNMLYRAGGKSRGGINTVGLDRHYARVYSWDLDLEILLKGWRMLGVD